MNRNFYFLTAVLAIVLSANGCSNKSERPPNFIFILADDLGFTQTGCYGSSYYKTPNIDRLASEGMRFTNAYAACPVCSPTRASIMTGKYPARLHLTNFIPGEETKSEHLVAQPDWQKYLPLEEVTIAELLKERGYTTALFGKWHLSKTKFGPESLPHYPDKQGFDNFFVIDKPNKNDNPENDPHKSDSIGNASVKFLHENAKNPFFLFVSFSAIHNPLMDSADSIAMWKNSEGSEKPENNPVIAAMLSRMDRNIGKITSALDLLDLAENTVVVFFSDNGGLASDALQTPLRNGKGWLYEGGIREPLIVKWEKMIQPGTVCESLISSIDFLPTILEIAGVDKLPVNIDGKSFVPALSNPESEIHTNLYWHFPHYHNGPPGSALRSGNWKLIEWHENSILENGKPAFELYDLATDQSETTDLSESNPQKVEEMKELLSNWKINVDAQIPTVNQSR